MKCIGLLLLCGGLCMLGVCASQHLRRHEKNLNELICGFKTVRREMKHSLAPLSDLFREGSAQTMGCVSVFFAESAECADNLSETDFKTSWSQIIGRQRRYLAHAELLVLQQLGGVLGRYDADEQILAIDAAIDRLEELCRLAGGQSVRLGRVYTVLGVISGAFAFLMFI